MRRLTHDEHLQELRTSLTRLREIAAGDLDARVPTCPGWQVRNLLGHLGRVHRMALAVITTGAMSPSPPKDLEAVPDNDLDLRAYFSASADALLHDLEATDPSAPCWTFLGTADEVGFWSRRMANEHAVHLYDAERALSPDPVPAMAPRAACDAIDEYFLIANSRQLAKTPGFMLGGSIHLHATDDEQGEWMITSTPGRLQVEPGHGKGDAAIRGTASNLLLGLWGRLSLVEGPEFQRFGDGAVVATLAALGGN
jgi:uncharacterized protein (TIGR03083 family)